MASKAADVEAVLSRVRRLISLIVTTLHPGKLNTATFQETLQIDALIRA